MSGKGTATPLQYSVVCFSCNVFTRCVACKTRAHTQWNFISLWFWCSILSNQDKVCNDVVPTTFLRRNSFTPLSSHDQVKRPRLYSAGNPPQSRRPLAPFIPSMQSFEDPEGAELTRSQESLNCFSPGDSEDAVCSWRGQRRGFPLPNILSAIRSGFKYYFKCLYIPWMFALACQECQMGSVCTLGAFLLIPFQHASTAKVFHMISNSIWTQVPSVCTYCSPSTPGGTIT